MGLLTAVKLIISKADALRCFSVYGFPRSIWERQGDSFTVALKLDVLTENALHSVPLDILIFIIAC